MDAEDFKEQREQSKIRRQGKQEALSIIIVNFCKINHVNCEFIQPWHIRLSKFKKRIDIFPQTKKYHDLTTNSRGIIRGTLTDFLNKNFL